jgi:hypothetical protein
MQTFRKGDIVTVRGTVEYDYGAAEDKLLFIKVPGFYQSVALSPDQWKNAGLALVQPRFDVGDDVRWSDRGGNVAGQGTILAISNDHAWIDIGGGGYCTRMLGTIERVPAEAVADAA